ncbi:MAG: hypothetical protein J0M24_18640 [Verrucomicrobia bacterium]|nr:hypothetical protein [Verrucomicrobiota bacterium]
MSDLVRTFDAATEEAASLYVLDLLTAEEQRQFAARLADEASLREFVRDLQGGLDTLVLAQPKRAAPLHVWGRIAAEVKEDEDRIQRFPGQFWTWGRLVLAAAACLAAGVFLGVQWTGRTPSSPSVASGDPVSSPVVDVHAAASSRLPVPVVTTPPRDGSSPVVATPPPQPTPAELALARENQRLRDRDRMWSSQVAALNRVLQQQPAPSPLPVVLPPGVSRLQVFRLANTNTPEGVRHASDLNSLPDALAALAAGNRGALVGPPAEGSATLAATDAPTDLPLNEGQPIAFFDPETGRGAVALVNDSPSAEQNFVVWSQSTAADGSLVYTPVGAASADRSTAVISFTASASSGGAPSFMVTLEPVESIGSLSAPRGPVVALPPAAKP